MWINIGTEDAQRAQGCLGILLAGVKFNICQINTSHKFNAEIQGLEETVMKHIPSELQYSCKYWISHFDKAIQSLASDSKQDFVQDISESLGNLLSGPKCLYWIEILSLTESIHLATDGLHLLLPALQVCIHHQTIKVKFNAYWDILSDI